MGKNCFRRVFELVSWAQQELVIGDGESDLGGRVNKVRKWIREGACVNEIVMVMAASQPRQS